MIICLRGKELTLFAQLQCDWAAQSFRSQPSYFIYSHSNTHFCFSICCCYCCCHNDRMATCDIKSSLLFSTSMFLLFPQPAWKTNMIYSQEQDVARWEWEFSMSASFNRRDVPPLLPDPHGNLFQKKPRLLLRRQTSTISSCLNSALNNTWNICQPKSWFQFLKINLPPVFFSWNKVQGQK